MVRRKRVIARGFNGRRRVNVGRALGAVALVAMIVGAGVRAFAAGDIVLYAPDFTTIRGNWATVASSTGAGGQMLSSVDRGWATADSPLAAPADYVEATFSAPSYTPYHVWIRLRATSDSKYNDSAWVQFSDALDLNQNAVYPIGSTRGLGVNLENCSGCGVSGWGWQDKSYWLQQANVVQFASGTTHTIRVQTREDGVQIDQVILSPATYLGSAPGSVTNDTKIVPKSSTTAVVAAASSPYSGSAALIPGLIQNEQFDNGGEGVSYHDTTTGNNGGAFRQTDVDLEPTASGYDVGWVAAGEWLNYSVNVGAAGSYTAEFRVASSGQGGTFHLEMNGVNVTGTMTVPNTGGWQTWQTVTTTVSLAAGRQTARLVMDTAGSAAVGNFDWMQFTAATPAVVTSSAGAPAAPNSSNPADTTLGVTVTPNLSWKAAGATSYDIRFGTSNPPPTVVSNTTNYWYAPATLGSGTKYYWQIVARNSSGSTAGAVWSFSTDGTSSTSTTPPSSTAGVAVATWNIQVDDSSAAHARTAMDYLAALSPQPQVIVIEEGRQSQYATYINELQNRTGLTWSGVFQPHCPSNAWNGSACTVAEDEGVGIFTSLPILGSSTTYLPYADAYHSARSLVRVAVNVGGRTVQVMGTHMPGWLAPRNSAMVALKSWASGFSKPQLVAGDFNADPDQIDISTAMGSAFLDSWSVVGSGRGFTCTTPSPTMKLDYWFADGSGSAQPLWTNVGTSTGTVSDHFPVTAYFSLK
jgi:endonuclease/exonuclease/phosphatase family metal-dependent hydrolase